MEGNHGAYGPLSLIGLDRWRVFIDWLFIFRGCIMDWCLRVILFWFRRFVGIQVAWNEVDFINLACIYNSCILSSLLFLFCSVLFCFLSCGGCMVDGSWIELGIVRGCFGCLDRMDRMELGE